MDSSSFEDGAAGDTASKFQLLSRWVLDNTRTAEELKDAQAKIRVTDETTDGPTVEGPGVTEAAPRGKQPPESDDHGQDSCFGVSRNTVASILNPSASLQLADLMDRLSASQYTIALSRGELRLDAANAGSVSVVFRTSSTRRTYDESRVHRHGGASHNQADSHPRVVEISATFNSTCEVSSRSSGNLPDKAKLSDRMSHYDRVGSAITQVLIIDPPSGRPTKTRQPARYTPLPTSTSIRLMKLYSLRGPGPLYLDDPIRCSIVVVDLTDVPDYIALSYTWGDPRTIYTEESGIFPADAWASAAYEVGCDGHAVSVATNLYTALIAIRGGLSSGKFAQELEDDRFGSHNAEYSYIWIDALCINQDDPQEKSNQVPLMNRIYSQARATIMWLGGGELLINQGVVNTLEKLKVVNSRLAEGLGPEDEERLVQRCKLFDICDPEAYERLGMEPIDRVDLVGWYLLFSRSWFKRAWTVQEWVLSPSCLFLCGNLMLSPKAIITSMWDFMSRSWLVQIQKLVQDNIVDPETAAIPTGNHENMLSDPERPWRFGSKKYADVLPLFRGKLDYGVHADIDKSFVAVQSLRGVAEREGSSKPETQPMEDSESLAARMDHNRRQLSIDHIRQHVSIDLFRSRRCSDPRDKIYAFHGIFRNTDGTSIFPAPDYNKPVREVYVEATRAVAADRGISFLHFREQRSSNPKHLPSWVPDFEVDSELLEFIRPFTEQTSPFMAAAGLGTSTLSFKDDDKLGLFGCRVDTVIRPEPYSMWLGTMRSDCRHLVETLCHLPEESLIATPPTNAQRPPGEGRDGPATVETTKQSRFEVLWRTLVQDTNGEHHPASSEVGQAIIARFRAHLKLQYFCILLGETIKLMEDVRQEESAGGGRGGRFFTRAAEQLEKHKLYRRMIAAEAPVETPEPSVGYDSEGEAAALFEIHAFLEMLQGRLSFDSKERPAPASWARHLRLWRNAWAARRARDYEALDREVDQAWKNFAVFEVPPAHWTDPDRYGGNRVLFATSGGRLGLISGGVEHGDEVWLLPGLNVPVVLRSMGDGQYSLVGVAYVHGIMHGEGVPASRHVVGIDLV